MDSSLLNDPFFRRRQTGRTSRMIAHAFELSEQGRAVYIIAANTRHAKDLQARVSLYGIRVTHGIKIETPESVRSTFDWQALTLIGAHPNCVVLVDHYAIESHFEHVLQMWTRYDLPPQDRLYDLQKQ
jgi:hypothetical protein